MLWGLGCRIPISWAMTATLSKVSCASPKHTKECTQAIWQGNAERASLCLGLVEMVVDLQVKEMQVQTGSCQTGINQIQKIAVVLRIHKI